jgi:predicted  nucleic acid-binding Zn-ribbon protein
MTSRDDLRWAARYEFVDDLWRDRARVIFDPEIEDALLRGAGEGERALLDALVPRSATDGVWVVVSTADVAARLGRRRSGVTFLPVSGVGDLLRRADWDVALVDLAGLGTEDEQTDEAHTRVDPRRELPEARRASMLAELGRGVEQGRAVVLSVPAAVGGDASSSPGLDYGELADILADELGGGRIYGLYQPPMAAIVEFGERIEPFEAEEGDDDAQWADDTGSLELPVSDALDADEDVPLAYDNTLGSQEPEFSHYVAVAGAEPSASGLTLIELPIAAHDDRRDEEAVAALRAQLHQARRRADLAAIDRQAHLERVDALEAQNERLRADVAELRDRLARAVDAASSEAPARASESAGQDRLDAALAREQALRWRVTQLERELDALVGRPVDALEAEVASLRARLAAAQSGQAPQERAIDTAERARRPANGHRTEIVAHPLGPASAQAAVRAVEDLVKRVERGGIGTLELRRNLIALRRRLQR